VIVVNKLNTKNQMIIIGAALVLMVVLFYFFAWTPQLTQLEDLDNQAKAEQGKIEAAKAKIAMLSEVKKNAANAEVELIKIQNKMPADAKLPSLVVELQNMANDAGVKLVSIKPSEPKAMGDYSSIDMNLSVVGSYVSLVDFLRRVEKSTRSMSVATIDISVAQYPDLALNLTATAFTMGVAGAPATPGAPAATNQTAPAATSPAQQSGQPQAGAPAQSPAGTSAQPTTAPTAAPAVSAVQSPSAGPVMSGMQPMLMPGSSTAYANANTNVNPSANTNTNLNTNVSQTAPYQTMARQ
jgi:Tfp pilus assembly protein PilO